MSIQCDAIQSPVFSKKVVVVFSGTSPMATVWPSSEGSSWAATSEPEAWS